ncbi:helix-turn-helix transcriptional regulator [Brevibacillus parabrevis]|uniref:helix-turn-helix domain-containing protein n=1 Tax=Brevibacillus parabrevis TaxID=54914 RepID=UPI0028D5D6D3|nr:helix-turn-helix transcriptional regulator [Brevibacillus parabrevis]
MSNLRKLVGAQIRVLRKQKDLSQLELATRAGLQDTYIGGVERGTRNISLDTFEKIVNALEVEPIEVFMFGEIDTETDLHEKKQIVESIKSLLLGRSVGEIRMMHRVIKDVMATFDAERSKE